MVYIGFGWITKSNVDQFSYKKDQRVDFADEWIQKYLNSTPGNQLGMKRTAGILKFKEGRERAMTHGN